MRAMTNSLKAALWTALFSFLTLASLAVLGFLAAVQRWLDGSDPTLTDDLSVLGKLLLAAIVSALIGFVNWVVRALQSKGVLPGQGPKYNGGA